MFERNTDWLPLTHNPGMCPNWESNQRPFGSKSHRQVGTQSAEPHQPGLNKCLEWDFFTHSSLPVLSRIESMVIIRFKKRLTLLKKKKKSSPKDVFIDFRERERETSMWEGHHLVVSCALLLPPNPLVHLAKTRKGGLRSWKWQRDNSNTFYLWGNDWQGKDLGTAVLCSYLKHDLYVLLSQWWAMWCGLTPNQIHSRIWPRYFVTCFACS